MNNFYTVSGDYIKVTDEHIISNKCEYFQNVNLIIPNNMYQTKEKTYNLDVNSKYENILSSRHYDKDSKLNIIKLKQDKEITDNLDIKGKYENILSSRHYGAK
jgi:hypothetical protein